MANTIINGGASPYPKHVGPAPICSFSDGAQDAPLKSLKFYIEPQQDLHGYDYPWPAGGGKNIAKLSADTEGSNQRSSATYSDSGAQITATGTYARFGWVIPVTAGTTYTLSFKGIASNTGDGYFGSVVIGKADAAWSTSSADYLASRNLTTTVQSFSYTFTATTNILFIGVYVTTSATSGTVTLSDVQVEANASATSYAPYSNISPISGWTQVDGQLRGINLLGPDALVPGYYGGTGAEVDQGLNKEYRTPGYIPVEGGSTLCVGYGNYAEGEAVWCAVCWYTEDKTMIGNRVNNSLSPIASFVAPSNAAYARVTMRTYDHGTQYCFASYGQTVFVEQKGTPITIQLGQTVYGGTVDALQGEGKSALGKFDIDSVDGVAANGVFYKNVGNYKRGEYVALCNTLKGLTQITNTTAMGSQDDCTIALQYNTSYNRVFIKYTAKTTVADMNAWLSANPTYLLYPLVTEDTLSLTPVSGLTTLLGQNNIWANTGDTELDYYPAAASVVAVLNRSSKVYTSIPLGKIRYDTYQTTPNQALDLDSYRAETGVLIRNVLSHTATKIEFNTPSMTNTQWEEVWNIIKAGFNNSTERKLKLKYYDQMSATYKTGWFYVPDVNFTVRNIDEANGIINYDEIRVAFIEY